MVVITQGQLEDLILAGKPVEKADLSEIDWSDLVDGALPPQGTVCNADFRPFFDQLSPQAAKVRAAVSRPRWGTLGR